MSKKSEFSPISEKEVANVLATLVKLQGTWSDAAAMSAADRRASLKMQSGGAQVIPTIAAVAVKHQVELPGKSIAEMAPRMTHAERLRVLLGEVNALQTSLKDAILVSEGTAWDTATATYSALRRMAKRQPAITTELAAAIAFFKKTAKAKAPKADPAPAATPPKT